jgi:phosphoesterase RecJ-like protein
VAADDLDGVVEFPRSVEGVQMALMFRELNQGRVKVSLRSVGDVDVAAFAKHFGGGGHTKAAGLSLEGSLAEAQAVVLAAAREYLNGEKRETGNEKRETLSEGGGIVYSPQG